MSIPDGQSDPTSLLLTLEVVSNVLKRAADPSELGNYVTQEMRELTGARTAIVLRSRDGSGNGEPTVVSVCPERRRHLAESKETHRLAQMCLKTDKVTFWEAGEDAGEVGVILAELGVGLSMAVPLRVGEFHVGCVLLFDLPERRHLDLVAGMLETLSTAVALILRNSFLYNEQEEIVQTATQELQAANQQLRGHEQQLQASNVQLIANEQQLRATNQQLMASERELRKSEKRYRTLVEANPHGIQEINASGIITYANPAYEKMLGYAEQELLGVSVLDLLDPESKRDELRNYLSTLVEEQPQPTTYYQKNRTKDGRVIDMEVDWNYNRDSKGRVVGFTSVITDVTERKQAQDALMRREERFRRLIQGIPDIVYTFSDKRGGIFYSSGVESILGYTAPYLLGHPMLWHNSIHADDLAAVNQVISDLRNGKDFDVEYRIRDADGNWHWFRDRTFGKWQSEGENIVEGIASDITERKDREKKLSEYRNQLRSLVSELTIAEDRERKKIASLLHDDVLQKLALSKMKLGMLRQTLALEDQLETLDDIHDYVSEMFKDMRTLTFDLCPPVLYDIGLEAALRDWFQKEMVEKHGIAVNLETQGQPLHLREDVRVALYRAIRELLMNVIKHAKAHKVNVTLANLDDTVRVEVADDGIGFDRSRAERDEEYSGGLGLFTVCERLEYFGGSLETESAPGEGSRVTLTAALTDREALGKGAEQE